MKRLVIFVAVALMLGSQGCSTTGGGRSTLQVSLLHDGKVSVDGRVAAMHQLPGAVKSAGAGRATSITVAVTEGTSQAEMMKITTTLRNAGYARVLFTRPRRTGIDL